MFTVMSQKMILDNLQKNFLTIAVIYVTRVIVGLSAGLMIGSMINIELVHTKILIMLFMVSLDSLIGGLKSMDKTSFNDSLLISGFFINFTAGLILLYVGDKVDINLYYAALIALTIRILKNFSVLRRHILKYRINKT